MKSATLFNAVAAAMLSIASMANGNPEITGVQFSGSPGDCTLTITGSGFGTLPGLPFAGDSSYFRIADAAQLGFGEWGYTGDAKSLTYESWSDTQIQMSGFGGQPGDAIAMAVWNPDTGLGATWGGNVPGGTGTPQVTSVTFSGSGQDLQIDIRGSGFGNAPVAMPFTGDLDYLGFGDFRTHCGDGSALFGAGFGGWGVVSASSVTLNFQSWSDNEIVIDGFAGSYGEGCATLQDGDPVVINVWNTSDTDFTGPQTAWGGFATETTDTIFLFPPCVNGLQVDLNGGVYPSSSGASATNLVWDWGDGQQTNAPFVISHTYASAGSYTIQVTAYYNDGTAASTSQTANVAPGVLSGCTELTISAGPGGSVTYQASVASGIVQPGGSVTLQQAFEVGGSLTANASPGYSFSDWSPSSGISGLPNGTPVDTNSASIAIVVNTNSQITANFSTGCASIDDLIGQVDGTGLSPGRKHALDAKLLAAQRSLSHGRSKAAHNQLHAFINQVNALARTRRLDTATADSLMACAEALGG